MASRYRKKPVVIEARQLTAKNVIDLLVWVQTGTKCHWDDDPVELQIKTLEGTMVANEGDWIIRGIDGEFYPCKPDIFAATYEEVRDGE